MVNPEAALDASHQGLIDSTLKAEADVHDEILAAAARGQTYVDTERLNREIDAVQKAVVANLKAKGYRACFSGGDWELRINDSYRINWGPLHAKPWWKFW